MPRKQKQFPNSRNWFPRETVSILLRAFYHIMISAVLPAACGGGRKTWQILPPAFPFRSNIKRVRCRERALSRPVFGRRRGSGDGTRSGSGGRAGAESGPHGRFTGTGPFSAPAGPQKPVFSNTSACFKNFPERLARVRKNCYNRLGECSHHEHAPI